MLTHQMERWTKPSLYFQYSGWLEGLRTSRSIKRISIVWYVLFSTLQLTTCCTTAVPDEVGRSVTRHITCWNMFSHLSQKLGAKRCLGGCQVIRTPPLWFLTLNEIISFQSELNTPPTLQVSYLLNSWRGWTVVTAKMFPFLLGTGLLHSLLQVLRTKVVASELVSSSSDHLVSRS